MIDNVQSQPCSGNLSPYLGATRSYISPPPGMGNLPRQNSIRVLFHGLTLSWFTSDGCYVVGAYNEEANHRRRLQVWELNPDKMIGDYDKFNVNSTINLDVISPLRDFERPGKFEPRSFNRLDDAGGGNPYYRHHFRWKLNFGKELYGDHLNKMDEKVRPLFTMNSGLLYTACRSIPLHKEEAASVEPLGRVAEFTAANIYFQPPSSGEVCARLLIDGQKKEEFIYSKQYALYWVNSCEPEKCFIGKEVDLSELSKALVRPSGRFVSVKNITRCDGDETSSNEQNDSDIQRGLKIHSKGFEEVDPEDFFVISRFDPCGGGWIGV